MTHDDAPEPMILNVDDYAPGRYARTTVLRRAGIPVVEAGSGQAALAMVDLHRPVLVLLDVNLPDMSGFEVCRQIRDNPKSATTTILHISASSTLAQHQVHGLDSGADAYLVEPIEPAVLIATVKAFLRARRAEDALRKSNEELRWFAYRVGHDLNEPLRTITAYAQLLKSTSTSGLDADSGRFLDFIADAAIRVRSFMDGLVEYSLATTPESRILTVECEPLLSRVVANLASAIEASGATITHDPLPCVSADDRLEHVFQNIISNAIKYRRPGVPPVIHISAVPGNGEWTFSIRDNGIGIEPQYQEGIFEIFRRLHGQEIPGNGIGLALSRKIIEKLGGAIWIESECGVGSTFYFKLPSS